MQEQPQGTFFQILWTASEPMHWQLDGKRERQIGRRKQKEERQKEKEEGTKEGRNKKRGNERDWEIERERERD